MSKRGRPRKADGWRLADADAYAIKALQAKVDELTKQLDDYTKMADEKVRDLTEERDNARRSSEDRFIMGHTLAKQLAQAEDRIKELLSEIRTYEHEHMTLRQIIIDGLRRD